MSVEENRELIEKWYIALEQGDFETIYNMHHDDVVYNMLGNTPVSGRIYGKDACCNGMIGEKLLEKLVSDKVQFSKKWKIKKLVKLSKFLVLNQIKNIHLKMLKVNCDMVKSFL